MKLISFFSKFTFICNISFVLFMIFNKIEAKKAIVGGRDTVVAIPFFKDLIIVLGISAIFINFVMCAVYLFVIIGKRFFLLPKWLPIINFIFLIVEFYFFFLS